MRYVFILLHSVGALLPTLAVRQLVPAMNDHDIPYQPFCGCMALVFLAVGSAVPLLAAAVARNIRRSRGDPSLTPLHPVGWVTIAGFWGHIPALWWAAELSEEIAIVSFSILGPPLIALSVVLSWRYVLKKECLTPPPPKGHDPDPEEF